jgi:hypothetical protein
VMPCARVLPCALVLPHVHCQVVESPFDAMILKDIEEEERLNPKKRRKFCALAYTIAY